MKKLLLLGLLLVGCATAPKPVVPKYKVGDCVLVGTMSIMADGDNPHEMGSRGLIMGDFKVLAILDMKPSKYMNDRFNADKVYLLKNFPSDEEVKKLGYKSYEDLIIPVVELDGWRYAEKGWEWEKDGPKQCSRYREDN